MDCCVGGRGEPACAGGEMGERTFGEDEGGFFSGY